MEGFNYGALKPTAAAKGKNRVRDSCALDSSTVIANSEKQEGI